MLWPPCVSSSAPWLVALLGAGPPVEGQHLRQRTGVLLRLLARLRQLLPFAKIRGLL